MKIYNIFISHSWQYEEQYKRLCGLLDKASYFDYKNYSVPKDNPVHTNGTEKQLREAISRHMSPSSIVLILAGVYSTYSKWIKKEIKIAKDGFSSQKPIIGIKPRENTNISTEVRDNAVEIVNWNTKSIVDAIKKHA